MRQIGSTQSLKTSLWFARTYIRHLAWLAMERPERSHGRVRVGDVELYFKSYGSGEPVVLLHGGFVFSEFWAGQFRELSRGNLVVAPDSRGHGRSTLGEAPMTYRRLARDTAGLIEHLGLGPSDLVGWSDGGCTCIALALDRPDLVRSITLIGTPYNTDNYSREALQKIRRFLSPVSIDLLGLRMLRRLLTPEPRAGRAFKERMSRMWTELPDFTVEELGRIEAPALVIACDKDEFLSLGEDPLSVFRETARAIPRSETALVHGGTHEVHMQYPRKVNRLISEFISRA